MVLRQMHGGKMVTQWLQAGNWMVRKIGSVRTVLGMDDVREMRLSIGGVVFIGNQQCHDGNKIFSTITSLCYYANFYVILMLAAILNLSNSMGLAGSMPPCCILLKSGFNIADGEFTTCCILNRIC